MKRLFLRLWYNDLSGEVAGEIDTVGVELKKGFLAESPFVQVDVMSDAVELVTRLYEQKVAEWQASLPPGGSSDIH